jgi:uncharacterized membrane protein
LLPILFGLTAALGWGAADFAGGFASRRTAAYQVVLFGEAAGLLVLFLTAWIFPEPAMSLKNWLWCGAGGMLGTLGLWLLYYSLSKGHMSIAAPVSALMAAILPVIAGSFLEGLPGWTRFTGFALALISIWLVSQNGSLQDKDIRISSLLLPLIAGIGFGMYFILFTQGSREGLIWPMVASRSAGTLTITILVIARRMPLRPAPNAWLPIVLNGVLDISGNAFYVLASQAGRMDVAVVLGSLYPGATVLLACLILSERLSRPQMVGVLTALGAIVVLTL